MTLVGCNSVFQSDTWKGSEHWLHDILGNPELVLRGQYIPGKSLKNKIK